SADHQQEGEALGTLKTGEILVAVSEEVRYQGPGPLFLPGELRESACCGHDQTFRAPLHHLAAIMGHDMNHSGGTKLDLLIGLEQIPEIQRDQQHAQWI